jgi:hypothetical protein
VRGTSPLTGGSILEIVADYDGQFYHKVNHYAVNWLLVVVVAGIAFLIGAGLIWAYDDDRMRKAEAEEAE